MTDSPVARKSQVFKPTILQPFARLLPSIVINTVLSLGMYTLARPHMPNLAALALAAIPPVLYAGYSWLRVHSIDVVSVITLFTLVVSMLLGWLADDARLLLLKDSYLTGTFGLLCLLSLMSSKPAAYYVYKWAFVRTPEQLSSLNTLWQLPYGRFARRLVTAVWGLVFVVETLVDTFLVFHLPTGQFLAIHPFLYWGTLVGVMSWATLYSRHIQQKIAILRQSAQEQIARTSKD